MDPDHEAVREAIGLMGPHFTSPKKQEIRHRKMVTISRRRGLSEEVRTLISGHPSFAALADWLRAREDG